MLSHSYRYIRYLKILLLILSAGIVWWNLWIQNTSPDVSSTTFLIPAGIHSGQQASLQTYISEIVQNDRKNQLFGVVLVWRSAEYLIPETSSKEQFLKIISTLSLPKREVASAEEFERSLWERITVNQWFSQWSILTVDDAGWQQAPVSWQASFSSSKSTLSLSVLLIILIAALL